MELNFDATARLTEALLPLLRRSAPSSIVNVASTAGRDRARELRRLLGQQVRRSAAGATRFTSRNESTECTSAWCCPATSQPRDFPRASCSTSARTRWIVSTPDKVAEAILEAGPGGKAERFVPRAYRLLAGMRTLAPGLVRRALRGGPAAITPATGADAQSS